MIVSAVLSFTVKVACPNALVTPVTVVMVELPDPAVSVTVLPDTRLGTAAPSFNVTVMVEVLVPSAGTDAGDAGFALTVEFIALIAFTTRLAAEEAVVVKLVAVLE